MLARISSDSCEINNLALFALRSCCLVQLTHVCHERFHQDTPTGKIMHTDVPLRPVRAIVEAPHNILCHLLRAACQARGHTNVVANSVEHTFQAVGAVEAVAGHGSFLFAEIPQNA